MNLPQANPTPERWATVPLLKWCETYFRERGIRSPRLEAEILLAHVLGCSRMDLYMQFDRPVSMRELDKFRPLVRSRGRRIPVAYLTGRCGFRDLDLAVGPGCLIPRQDTEVLVETALHAIAAVLEIAEPGASGANEHTRLNVLELGTGCGAIALALCAEAHDLAVVSCEISGQAMDYAAANLRQYRPLLDSKSNRLTLIRTDKFEGIATAYTPSLIVSNPPYIPSGLIPTLEPEVARSEPVEALDGGNDGLGYHGYLLEFASRRLPRGGRVVLEIGYDQAPALEQILGQYPALELLEFRRDLAGHQRVLYAAHR